MEQTSKPNRERRPKGSKEPGTTKKNGRPGGIKSSGQTKRSGRGFGLKQPNSLEKKERLERLKQTRKPQKESVFQAYETPKNHAKVRSMRSLDIRARFDAMFTWLCIAAIGILALMLIVLVQKSKENAQATPAVTTEADSTQETEDGTEILSKPDVSFLPDWRISFCNEAYI